MDFATTVQKGNSRPDPKPRLHFYPLYKVQLHDFENKIIRSIPRANLFPKHLIGPKTSTLLAWKPSFYGY